jgi:S-methyl-5-thioribulose 1-phosphate isomerase
MTPIVATYRLTCAADEVERLSRDIALEQTVEVPESLIVSDQLREAVVGRVTSILPVEGTTKQFDARIEYPADLAASGLSSLLNLIYGNISLKRCTRLRDVCLPAAVLSTYRGPKLGVAGLRRMLDVFGRPLLATALKPRGSSPEQLAARANAFAAGGGDLVKDDHNLVDVHFDDFRRRVELCQQAAVAGSQQTGRTCLYFPNLAAPAGQLERRAEFLVKLGVRGVLISPMLVGLDQVRLLAEKYPLAFLAHPTFAGAYFHDPSHGIEPGLLLGTLFRLAGCDGTIYPNLGGRFSFTADDCRQIAQRALEPLGELHPAWPAPAGGMSFDNIPQMANEHGADAIFLIGGALLEDSNDLRASTARFLAQIVGLYPGCKDSTGEALPRASNELISACELPGPILKSRLLEHIRFLSGFRWDGRAPVAYKASDELLFRDISRTELIGNSGEQTAFDIRYFEVGPGGHSSLEKHLHTHVVIAVRGSGTLLSGDTRVPLQPFDVAYIPPLQVHQLRNESADPFGFFCIVDHDRDRPIAP